MQAIDQEPQYQGLTAEFVLRTIPDWLSCRFCLRRGNRLKIPNEMGVTNHFAQSRHNNTDVDTEAAAASSERPSMWSTQNRVEANPPPPEPVQDAPPYGSPQQRWQECGLGSVYHPFLRSSPSTLWDTVHSR